MIKEAKDFLEEARALEGLIGGAGAEPFAVRTLFKCWTVEDVFAHLHLWNRAAGLTLESREKFQQFAAQTMKEFLAGESHLDFQRAWLDEYENGARGEALFAAWRDYCPRLADAYAAADAEARLAWVGPDMSATNAIVARQMETWAHGQEIFDALGRERTEQDRIRNICHLGVTTYGWTFRNRGLEPPQPKPYVRLTAPSGAAWEWNESQDDNAVTGEAVHFAQVVTQTRNVADTELKAIGSNARRWMAIAQCFAGAPEDPPAPGARFMTPAGT